jgi:hypothetical protein
MKDSKRLSRQQQKRRLALSEIPLGDAGDIDAPGKPWMDVNLAILIDFIASPTLDSTHTAVSLAFSRISAIAGGMSTGETFAEEDWHYVASALLLEAEIMRRGFDLVWEYANNKSSEQRRAVNET